MSRFSLRHSRGYPLLTVAIGTLLAGCGGGGGGSGDSDLRSGSASVQGTIGIESGSRVDGDYADLWRVNDGAWPAGSADPVALPIPATAAGYLSSTAGTYDDDFEFPEDRTDRYTIETLLNGDRYALQCFPADGQTVKSLNVSLSLSTGGGVANTACGSGGIVTSSGKATLTVTANDGGPFRYVLTIAPQGSLAAFNVSWPEPDLRVNEAVMSGPAAAASTLSSSGLRASSMMSGMRSIGPDLWHIRRDTGTGSLSARTAAGSGDARAETIEWIRSMREDFGLEVEPNYLFQQQAPTLDDSYYVGSDEDGDPYNWNLAQIRVDEAWFLGGGSAPSGAGVGVAVLDTGLFSKVRNSFGDWHEDLANNVISSGGILDFVSGTYDVDGTDGRDMNPATPLTPGMEDRTSYHGTHVSGIIAAEDNAIGTIGIAYEATILPYRVLGVDPVTGADGTGSLADLIDAIVAASDRSEVDVINLSLGGLPKSDLLQAATDHAHANDVLVVAAAGNSGDASAVYPAANQRVVGVGATNRQGALASYSNYGQSVDLVAPGGDLGDGIANAYGPSDSVPPLYYAELAGTSMAAPHVAGVYALMKEAADVTPDQFRAQLIAGRLTSTQESTLVSDYSLHGMGLLDANWALSNSSEFPTVVSAWPRVLEVSATGAESEVFLEVLKDSGAEDPKVTSVPTVPDPFILTHGNGTQVSVNDVLNGSLRISVDPSAVASDRPLYGDIVIPNSGDKELVIPAYVQATDDATDRTAGRHYALLLDINDFGSSKSRGVVASFNNGQYRYSFDDVSTGDYILVAGTDLDNNGYICENGEACAEYPRTGFRGVITVRSGEAQRLDMTTSFRRPNIAEMGLPRYGFEGYSIPGLADDNQAASKQLK